MYEENLTGGVVLGAATTSGAVATLANTGATQVIATVLTGLLVVLFSVLLSGNVLKRIVRNRK